MKKGVDLRVGLMLGCAAMNETTKAPAKKAAKKAAKKSAAKAAKKAADAPAAAPNKSPILIERTLRQIREFVGGTDATVIAVSKRSLVDAKLKNARANATAELEAS